MYRIDTTCKQMALGLALVTAAVMTTPCLAATPTDSSDGFMMMTINTACGKQNPAKLAPNPVEQLQAVHKLSQNKSPETFQGLIEVLQSSSPLARRKAAKALLDEWPVIAQATKSQQRASNWVEQLKPFMKDTDWVVQKTVVRLLALMHAGNAKAAVATFTISMTPEDRAFFETGLTAVKPASTAPTAQADEPTEVIAVSQPAAPQALPEPPATITLDGLQKASLVGSPFTH